jgi:hypothetical protein
MAAHKLRRKADRNLGGIYAHNIRGKAVQNVIRKAAYYLEKNAAHNLCIESSRKSRSSIVVSLERGLALVCNYVSQSQQVYVRPQNGFNLRRFSKMLIYGVFLNGCQPEPHFFIAVVIVELINYRQF